MLHGSIDPAISSGDFLQLDVERLKRSDFNDFDVAFGTGSLPGHGMQAAAPRCYRGWASKNGGNHWKKHLAMISKLPSLIFACNEREYVLEKFGYNFEHICGISS